MIEDWKRPAILELFSRHEGNEQKAIDDVRKKYFDDFAKTKDLHFYLEQRRRTTMFLTIPYDYWNISPEDENQMKLF